MGNAMGDKRVRGLMLNQITSRIGATAGQAGLGSCYGDESPRLGMLKGLEELGRCYWGGRSRTRPLRSAIQAWREGDSAWPRDEGCLIAI